MDDCVHSIHCILLQRRDQEPVPKDPEIGKMDEINMLKLAGVRRKLSLIKPGHEHSEGFWFDLVECHRSCLSFFVRTIECRREERRVEAYEIFVDGKLRQFRSSIWRTVAGAGSVAVRPLLRYGLSGDKHGDDRLRIPV